MSATLFRSFNAARGVRGTRAMSVSYNNSPKLAEISRSHQFTLAMGSVGAWLVILGGAPWWAPVVGERMARVRAMRFPRFRLPPGVRIPLPRGMGTIGA